jgi:hypothetical protein
MWLSAELKLIAELDGAAGVLKQARSRGLWTPRAARIHRHIKI